MSVFIDNDITEKGRMLLAELHMGAIFDPTRVVMGAGYMPAGSTARSMTNVVTPIATLEINKKERTPDGKVIIGGVFTNETITEAFYFREFALYARPIYPAAEDGGEPTYGDEVLYSYGNAGDTAELMPAYSTSTVIERQMDLATWVGNDTEVNLTIESGVFMTQEQAKELIQSELGEKALSKEVYDPDGMNTDIFKYAREHGAVQSDWLEEDTTSMAHILNRPFGYYKTGPVTDYEGTAAFEFGSYDYPNAILPFSLTAGTEYVVTVDGEAVTLTAYASGSDTRLGKLMNGDPVYIMDEGDGTSTFVLNSTATGDHTVSVTHVATVPIVVPDEFLPPRVLQSALAPIISQTDITAGSTALETGRSYHVYE